MDGLMEPLSIQYLNLFRRTENYSVLLNLYKPRADYTIELYPYKRMNAKFVLQQFLDACGSKEQPLNVYGMVTSNALG